MVITAWMAELVLIFWRDLAGKSPATPGDRRFPWPSELLYTFVLFGVLNALPGEAGKVGAAIGWGVVVATFLNVWSPVNPLQVNAPSNPLQGFNLAPTPTSGPVVNGIYFPQGA